LHVRSNLSTNKLLNPQNKTTILTPRHNFLIHYIPLKYFTPFLKLLLSHYQTTILETEKDYWIIYKQKSSFDSWQPVFFSSVFIPWWNLFFKLTRTTCHEPPFRHYSTVVFAFWRGLCVVKGVEWQRIQFVKCNTGVILSQSTSAWQTLCARYFSQVGWSCPALLRSRSAPSERSLPVCSTLLLPQPSLSAPSAPTASCSRSELWSLCRSFVIPSMLLWVLSALPSLRNLAQWVCYSHS